MKRSAPSCSIRPYASWERNASSILGRGRLQTLNWAQQPIDEIATMAYLTLPLPAAHVQPVCMVASMTLAIRKARFIRSSLTNHAYRPEFSGAALIAASAAMTSYAKLPVLKPTLRLRGAHVCNYSSLPLYLTSPVN
jgi:hypothetical protein